MRRNWIEPKTNLPIAVQCILAGVGRSTYYTQQKPAILKDEDQLFLRLIDEEYTRHPFYGKRRIQCYLQSLGYRISARRVRRLMRLLMISGMAPGPTTSTPHPEHKVYPYLLRGVPIVRPNQVWSADITYIRLEHGFVYLVAIIDWYSRKVLSFRVSNTMDAGFCVDCLEEAIRQYGTPEIFNTDQGAQFTSLLFTGVLLSNDIVVSMDGRGRVFDNIFIERLWRTLKYEDIYLKGYASISELLIGLMAYFSFYNGERFHQALGHKTPDTVYTTAENGGAFIIDKFGKVTQEEVNT